jgi:hypothetical protein
MDDDDLATTPWRAAAATAPNHPHSDQRNWQPGDTDDDGPLNN